MLKLTNRYATALLEFARERGMGEIYRQALLLAAEWERDRAASRHDAQLPGEEAPQSPKLPSGDLGEFLALVPQGEQLPVLYRFLDLARSSMDLLECEIISAVPLRPEQLARLEEKLIRMFRKQLEITTQVDPSILGGLRVIVGNTVLDDTIKRKLSDMKERIYEGVYFEQ